LSREQPELAQRLREDYDQWWDGLYPALIAAGGDAPLYGAAVSRVKKTTKKTTAK